MNPVIACSAEERRSLAHAAFNPDRVVVALGINFEMVDQIVGDLSMSLGLFVNSHIIN
jgi:hypothetical protein